MNFEFTNNYITKGYRFDKAIICIYSYVVVYFWSMTSLNAKTLPNHLHLPKCSEICIGIWSVLRLICFKGYALEEYFPCTNVWKTISNGKYPESLWVLNYLFIKVLNKNFHKNVFISNLKYQWKETKSRRILQLQLMSFYLGHILIFWESHMATLFCLQSITLNTILSH